LTAEEEYENVEVEENDLDKKNAHPAPNKQNQQYVKYNIITSEYIPIRRGGKGSGGKGK